MRPRVRVVMLCADSHAEASRIAWTLTLRSAVNAEVNPAQVGESPKSVIRLLVVFSGLKRDLVNIELLEWLLAPWVALLPHVPVLYLSPDSGQPPVPGADAQALDDVAGLLEKIRTLCRKGGPKRGSGRVSLPDETAPNQKSNLA